MAAMRWPASIRLSSSTPLGQCIRFALPVRRILLVWISMARSTSSISTTKAQSTSHHKIHAKKKWSRWLGLVVTMYSFARLCLVAVAMALLWFPPPDNSKVSVSGLAAHTDATLRDSIDWIHHFTIECALIYRQINFQDKNAFYFLIFLFSSFCSTLISLFVRIDHSFWSIFSDDDEMASAAIFFLFRASTQRAHTLKNAWWCAWWGERCR